MTNIDRAVKIYSKMRFNLPFEGICSYTDIPTIKQYMRRHGWQFNYRKDGSKAVYNARPYDEAGV